LAARYRLRFLLQEFDLARGATLIGRSSECHVTIEDPLVSRQHARIIIDGDNATVHDLGSRNGVKLNGITVRDTAKLSDGDRLRVGTQELVFCRMEAPSPSIAKTTGFLRHCAQCRLPYPQEAPSCPGCGSSEQMDEETLSGQFGAASQGAWSVQLLLEVLDKALSLSRVADAERILRRATTQFEERLAQGEPVESKQLSALSLAAVRLACEAGDPAWGVWAAQVYRRVKIIPSAGFVEGLAQLATRYGEMNESIDHLATHCRAIAQSTTAEERDALARLEQLRAQLVQNSRHRSLPNPTLS
jgi:hypothetical protein